MAAVVENRIRRWTYEQYCKLDDDRRYEIIDGELLMAPSPDFWHQDWLGNLYWLARRHLAEKKTGRLLLAPFDVVLDSANTVQPDLVFVRAANARIVQARAVFGVPDLVVELILPSSIQRDRRDKKKLYARFGIQEYWIGDPAKKSMEILSLEGADYARLCAATESGRLFSRVLPGLKWDLADIQSQPL